MKMFKFDNTNPERINTILAARFALKSTCQLYQWKNEAFDIFEANGCAVLFECNSAYYCFSNAHVLADAQLGKTFFQLKDGTSMTVGGEHFFSMPLSSEKRQEDSLDIAIVKLNANVVERLLDNGQIFLKLSQIQTPSTLVKGDVLLISGYPATKTKINLKEARVEFNPLILRTIPYARKLKNASFTRGFHHIVEYPIKSFRETSTRQKMRGPQPHGISGSGLWLLPNGREADTEPKLIGILSEYHENSAIIISTKIDLFLDLLRQRFDASLRHNGIELELVYE